MLTLAQIGCLIYEIVNFHFYDVLQEEYLEALNEEEVAKKELEGETKMKERLEKELEVLQKDVTQLQDLHRQQDELLGKKFHLSVISKYILSYLINMVNHAAAEYDKLGKRIPSCF